MYVGHIAAALGGKGARPGIPLWFLVLAAQAPDWVVLIGRLTGYDVARIERFTETYISLGVIALPLAALYLAMSRDLKSSVVVWIVAASHPVLDFFTGNGPLLPGSRAQGLGWYQRPVYDFAIEATLLVVAAIVYRRSLPAGAKRSPAFVVFISSLLLFQATLDVYLASSKRNGRLAQEIHNGRLVH